MAKKVTSKKSNVVNNRPNCLKITKRTQKVNLQTVTTKDGKKIEYDVILTFKNEITNKDYIVYTDNQIDNQNKLRIFAAIYNPLTNQFLEVPESKEEWNEIYRLLDKVLLER